MLAIGWFRGLTGGCVFNVEELAGYHAADVGRAVEAEHERPCTLEVERPLVRSPAGAGGGLGECPDIRFRECCSRARLISETPRP